MGVDVSSYPSKKPDSTRIGRSAACSAPPMDRRSRLAYLVLDGQDRSKTVTWLPTSNPTYLVGVVVSSYASKKPESTSTG